jgi:tRNA nucleotidyltransferase (CCA-adding enzyme)
MQPATYQAITKHYALLQMVAPERLREELNRILLSGRPARGIRLILETGLLRYVAPEAVAMAGFDQRSIRHNKDVFEHTLAVVEAVPPRLKVRLAALLHDIGKPSTFSIGENGVGHFYGHHRQGQTMAESILRRLRYDNKTIEDVTVLVGEHMSRYPRMRNTTLKKLVNRVGEHNLEDLFDLQKADIMGSAPPFDFSELAVMQEGINRILNEKPPMSIKDLAVKGNDLIEIGFQPGPEMGRVLDLLLEAVLEDPEKNDRVILGKLAAKYLKSQGLAK